MCACVPVCVSACMRVCVYACVCVCVSVHGPVHQASDVGQTLQEHTAKSSCCEQTGMQIQMIQMLFPVRQPTAKLKYCMLIALWVEKADTSLLDVADVLHTMRTTRDQARPLPEPLDTAEKATTPNDALDNLSWTNRPGQAGRLRLLASQFILNSKRSKFSISITTGERCFSSF